MYNAYILHNNDMLQTYINYICILRNLSHVCMRTHALHNVHYVHDVRMFIHIIYTYYIHLNIHTYTYDVCICLLSFNLSLHLQFNVAERLMCWPVS